MIQKGKANIILGGQWGSEGKGKLAGYLYHTHPEIEITISDFTPNTGHTYIDEKGNKYISKILPIGALFNTVNTILIGPHAVFNVDRLMQDIEDCKKINSRLHVFIHSLASTLTSKDVEFEVRSFNHISSTMQGSCSPQIAKMMRNPLSCSFAKDNKHLRHMVKNTQELAQVYLKQNKTILIETGQGFDLGLNHGYSWPYVTGRDCMLGRWLDNAGVHPKQLGDTIVALRTYPIRVGNTEGGYSGPCYKDQTETTWENISENVGYDIREYTTVTKRMRRVFTWSNSQIKRMCSLIKPDYAFLNFVNYLQKNDYNSTIEKIKMLLNDYNCTLALLGTGDKLQDMNLM